LSNIKHCLSVACIYKLANRFFSAHLLSTELPNGVLTSSSLFTYLKLWQYFYDVQYAEAGTKRRWIRYATDLDRRKP